MKYFLFGILIPAFSGLFSPIFGMGWFDGPIGIAFNIFIVAMSLSVYVVISLLHN